TQTTVNLNAHNLAAGSVRIGTSTAGGVGMLSLDSGNLTVTGGIRFAGAASILDLGVSSSVRVGGDFLAGGTSGDFRAGTSTLTLTGASAQLVDTLGRNLSTV